jgi:murein DD-endopeptidase MepM/ murein hydrolase activator NlpD
VSISHKLKIALTTLVLVLVTMAVAAIPTASADQCTVTAVLLDGQTVSFTVNATPGTPPAQMLPPGTPPAKSVTANCQTATTPPPSATTTTSNPSTTTSPSHTSTTNSNSTGTSTTTQKSTSPGFRKPKSSGGKDKTAGKPKKNSSSSPTTPNKKASTPKSSNKKKKSTPKTGASAITGPGVPTPANPTFSFSLPGPAPLGVPNFFINSFEIPPFLLPIYQAAGIQYDVPWQVLAGINEIETDYGRNLSTSTAGAVGWMQFLPSTWAKYGVDATGSGYADPYNPVDAIFAAARYLNAAGASHNLYNAIYAYNHAGWYVQSVLLRAKLIGGMPGDLVGALNGLVEGHFPVAAPAKYADSSVTKLAKQRVKNSNAAITIGSNSGSTSTDIFAKQGSPVIAVNDGKIVKMGHDQKLGNFVELQDATGNVYTYAHLGQVSKMYPVPKQVKVTAAQIAKQLSLPATPKPSGPATAGAQQNGAAVSTSKANKEAKSSPISLPVTPAPASSGSSAGSSAQSGSSTQSGAIPQPMVKERLFANPTRPASYAAGGKLQIQNAAPSISNFQNYFSDVLHLGKKQYTLQPLKVGSIVVAGTILARIGAGTPSLASHLQFMIRPAGKKAPYIDPKPILDGWKLLEATAVYRAAGQNPFYGPGAKNPTIGQILLMSKEQLTYRVLEDPHAKIYACGRRDIQAGLIDRRIMAVIEFLSASGLDPTVSGLECGHSLTGSTGVDAAGATGASVDISKINNISVFGHQGKGSITDIAIRRLLTLQGTFKPNAIVSTMSYKGQSNTLALPDHANRIQITYTPLFGQNKKLSAQVADLLQPNQWTQLINHISQIPEPIVPIAPSKYAIKVPGG